MSVHIPVLLNQVLEMARGTQRPVMRFLDGTFGRGGHTRALLNEFPGSVAVGLDRDEAAIEYGKQNFAAELESGRLKLVRANYAEIAALGLGLFDLILLDLGVSSPQLETAERGFSFMHDGPLDMRMDRREPLTAADIVNEWDADDLAELFKTLGEIPRPQRVVNAIVNDRDENPFMTTKQLAGLIERVEGWSRKGHHPATRYFLALRLKVNHELEDVENVVEAMIDQLEDKGRLLIITFHSLEDRIVKYRMRELTSKGLLINKKVVKPEWEEQKKNPRARSAQLRGFERSLS
ncbi:MAG TPA: 16S rRNA (cytosine(1402)-N(4))-methyltransferase RsmH [Bdellovibrionales bacterium]|nr:16S rRNA (cytosine(1402)-N(4))-methyltransferase RsmH [Bdellovibrionales bacterium]